MSISPNETRLQGRIDVPLPPDATAQPHQGAIFLSEQELLNSQPLLDANAADRLVPQALRRRPMGFLN
jgi:hypothetical protein